MRFHRMIQMKPRCINSTLFYSVSDKLHCYKTATRDSKWLIQVLSHVCLSFPVMTVPWVTQQCMETYRIPLSPTLGSFSSFHVSCWKCCPPGILFPMILKEFQHRILWPSAYITVLWLTRMSKVTGLRLASRILHWNIQNLNRSSCFTPDVYK